MSVKGALTLLAHSGLIHALYVVRQLVLILFLFSVVDVAAAQPMRMLIPKKAVAGGAGITKIDNVTVADVTPSTSDTWSVTNNATTNDFILVAAGAFIGGGGGTITGATYNGVAMTVIGETGTDSGNRFALFGLSAPASGANNLVVSYSASASEAAAVVSTWENVHQTTTSAFSGFNSATGTSTTPAVTITSASGGVVVDGLYFFGVTATAHASQTTLGNAQQASSAVSMGSSYEAGATSVSMDWTLGGSINWGIAGCSIKQP